MIELQAECLMPISDIIPFVASSKLWSILHYTSLSPEQVFNYQTSHVSNVITRILGSLIAIQQKCNSNREDGATAILLILNPFNYLSQLITSCCD
ncbi:unnamed protein product [Paramecium primaurelia]|uniref:Uncharacterized protein n=1 Tax=Paramecium primaurelia TaxID=5886 RepID=A0A8S1NZC4_PARPR|nr:unnamed protein product [Paramecium primaurelia]